MPPKRNTMNKTEQQSYISKYLSGIDNIFTENKFYRYLVIGLILIVCYQTYLLQVSFQERKTIVMPSSKISYAIGTSSADKDYLAAISTSIIDLYLDINTSNIADKYTQLLKMFASESFAHYQGVLQSKASDLHEYNTISHSASLDPSKELEITENSITAPVSIRTYVGNQLSKTYSINLVIGYKLIAGKFLITSLQETINGQAK